MDREAAPDLKRGLECRALLYRVLADCYYPPEPSLAGSLESLFACLPPERPRLAEFLGSMLDSLKSESSLRDLAVDYSRLFVGPFSLRAPPYGSVYLDQGNTVMGPSTRAVLALYAADGLEPASDFAEAPDHIAVELEFLHHLAVAELSSSATGDLLSAREYREKHDEFLAKHLGQWLPSFAGLVERGAGTGFYRNLSRLTQELVVGPRGGQPSVDDHQREGGTDVFEVGF